jgi:hypothetical protein
MAMRSVVDALRREDREAFLRRSPGERVRMVLALGERDLETFRRAHDPPLSRQEARRRLERQRQAGRRWSGCAAALVG